MLAEILNIENYLPGSLLISLFVLGSIGGVILMRRYFDHDRLKHYHDVAGNMLSVGGTLYAVLLGLVVVDAMQTFEEARLTVDREANALANVYLLAEPFPAEKSGRVRELCRAYAAAVVYREWPLMNRGEIHEEARDLSLSLVNEIAQYEPDTENLKAVYPLLVQQALEIRDERRARTSMALYHLPAIEWVVLCAGAVITIVFTYFFRLESHRIQLAMTGMVALLIALNLYLIVLFAAPYSGDLRVKPDPILKDLQAFDNLVPIHLQPEAGGNPHAQPSNARHDHARPTP